ncbi:hypothetical protein NBRC116584_30430 [Hydrogenophaga sp. 5NK40-0174]
MQRRYMYMSHAVSPFSPDDLAALAMSSQRENGRRSITGILVHLEGHFLQLVEGPASAIGQLQKNLKADTRHRDVTDLLDEPVGRRLFDGWTLATERLFHRPDAPTSFAMEVARRLSRVAHSDSDFQVLGMLARFWGDFADLITLSEQQTQWHDAVLNKAP